MGFHNKNLLMATAALCFLMLLPMGHSMVNLPFKIVRCTDPIIQEDKQLADKSGRLGSRTSVIGNMQLYQEDVNKPAWLLYTGEFNMGIYNISMSDLSQVKHITLDFKFKVENVELCMHMVQ
ncbi:hypothetical protein C0J52_08469 [Blattella germanica]|nr:hypothetical protein C0J52_08469 [Blattella germanica]PSN49750.1 hypothetical protein C0J52_08469 [Blattella germanica]